MTTEQQWKKVQDHLKDAMKKGAKAYPEIKKSEKKSKWIILSACDFGKHQGRYDGRE